jgi:hypothetical protein
MADGEEPVGLDAADTVDAIVRDPPDGWVLVMVESREWGESPEQPDQLRRKLRSYTVFVQEGYLAESFPESEGGAVRIDLKCASEPPPDIARVIAEERERLQAAGIGLTVGRI